MKEAELKKGLDAFMRLRKLCGNSLSKKMNPTENICTKSDSGLCDISGCPLLKKYRAEHPYLPGENFAPNYTFTGGVS